MNDTVVKMKDGREYCAPIWYYRPKEGYITLVDSPILRLSEMESAISKNVWIYWDTIKDVDLLERARTDGWNGS